MKALLTNMAHTIGTFIKSHVLITIGTASIVTVAATVTPILISNTATPATSANVSPTPSLSSSNIILGTTVSQPKVNSSNVTSDLLSSDSTSSEIPNSTINISSNSSQTLPPVSSESNSSNETEQNIIWEYKNGGDDYIIKTDGKTSIKIPIDITRFETPSNTPTTTYTVKITRTNFVQVNDWIYFYEVYSCSSKTQNSPDSNWDGAGGGTKNISGLYRIKSNGTLLQKISETAATNTDEKPLTVGCILGINGRDMYFIRNHGYEPGGDLCRITLTEDTKYFVDNATVFTLSCEIPTSSYIKDGKIYLFGLCVSGTDKIIPINELTNQNN